MSSSCAGSNSPARICPLAEIEPIQIMGYADRLAVRPGEKIAFKVSLESGADRYRAHIVRLICGDDRPDGPGFREQEIDAAVNGEHAGRRQAIDCGSYVLVPGDAALDRPGRFTLAALVWPTLPGTGEQTILGGGGYRLGLDADGRLTLHLGRLAACGQAPASSAPLVSHPGEPRCGRGRDPLRGPGSGSGRCRQRDLPRQAAGGQGCPDGSALPHRRPSRRAGPQRRTFQRQDRGALPGGGGSRSCRSGGASGPAAGFPAAGRLGFRPGYRDGGHTGYRPPRPPWPRGQPPGPRRHGASLGRPQPQLARGPGRLCRHPFP